MSANVLLRYSLGLAALLALAAAPPCPQKPAELRWKLEKGKAFYQEMTTATRQRMLVAVERGKPPQEVNQTQSQTFIFRWLPLSHDPETGSWRVQQSIVGVRMNLEIGGNKVEYDSTADVVARNPLSEFFDALVGSEFTFTIDPRFQAVKIEGRKEFIDKLSRANPQMRLLLEKILSDDALKQMADPSFAAIPGKVVRPGEAWEKKSTLDMGPIGTYETTYAYTYQGKDPSGAGLDRIAVVPRLAYRAPGGAQGGALPFRILKADLKATSAEGQILFDAGKGRVAESRMSLTLEGELTIEIAKQAAVVRLAQAQQTDVRTTDDNPATQGKRPPRLLVLPELSRGAAPPVRDLGVLGFEAVLALDHVPARAAAVVCVRGLERSKGRLLGLLRKAEPALVTAAQAPLDALLRPWRADRPLRGAPADGHVFLVLLEVPRPEAKLRAAVLVRVKKYADLRDGFLTPAERATLKADPEGYERATVEGRAVYFVNRGGFAALTLDRDTADDLARLYDGLGTRLGKDASRWLLESDVSAYVNLAAVSREHGDWGSSAQRLAPLLDEAARLGLPRSEAALGKAVLGTGRRVAADGQSVLVALNFEPEGVAVRGRLDVAANSPTGQLLAGQKPGGAFDLHQLPAGFTTYSALELDATAWKGLQPLLRSGGQYRASGGGESLEVWPCAEAPQVVRAYTQALEALGPGATLQGQRLTGRPVVRPGAESYRGTRWVHVGLREVGGESDVWFGAVGDSLVQVRSRDWKAARSVLDRYLDGKDPIGAASNQGFSQTLERLPAESTWLGVVRVPAAGGKGDSYAGLSVTLRPGAVTLDGWVPVGALPCLWRLQGLSPAGKRE